MIPLDSSLALTQQLDLAFATHNVGPSARDVLYSVRQSDWRSFGVQGDVWTASHGTCATQGLSIPDRHASLPSASCCSTLGSVNTDVALVMTDSFPSPPGFDPPSGGSYNVPLPSLVQEPECSWCTSLGPEYCLARMLDESLAGTISYVNDEVVVYPSSSTPSITSCTIRPYPLTSFINQNMGESCETSSPDAFSPTNVPHLDSAEFEVFFNEIPSGFAPWTDNSSDPGETFEMVDSESTYLSAHLPAEQHFIASEEAVHHCEWIDENGAVCGDRLGRSTLSAHLSKHGIKSMSRDLPTKCKWAGCRRKKSMNRESIARHVREVHLQMKRPPKQEPRS